MSSSPFTEFSFAYFLHNFLILNLEDNGTIWRTRVIKFAGQQKQSDSKGFTGDMSTKKIKINQIR